MKKCGIRVCNEIKESKRESVLTNQLIRSGTSVGANIREAFYAHGKADFIAKLQIALKECSESEYWLELLIESGYYQDPTILEQCIEVKKMLISSIANYNFLQSAIIHFHDFIRVFLSSLCRIMRYKQYCYIFQT